MIAVARSPATLMPDDHRLLEAVATLKSLGELPTGNALARHLPDLTPTAIHRRWYRLHAMGLVPSRAGHSRHPDFTLAPTMPCAQCQTMEGYTPRGQDRPLRLTGRRWRLGRICAKCYSQLSAGKVEPRKAVVRALSASRLAQSRSRDDRGDQIGERERSRSEGRIPDVLSVGLENGVRGREARGGRTGNPAAGAPGHAGRGSPGGVECGGVGGVRGGASEAVEAVGFGWVGGEGDAEGTGGLIFRGMARIVALT